VYDCDFASAIQIRWMEFCSYLMLWAVFLCQCLAMMHNIGNADDVQNNDDDGNGDDDDDDN
jgi:hypothetical protein